jgi:sugar/nucleoside kinase (ribokinase family)
VVVGSAARDIDEDDPRGWRLGGGVTYGALTLGRLGLPTTALIGMDAQARSDAHELGLLRDAGIEVVPVPLEHGPVFINQEAPTGRRQTVLDVSDPVPISSASAIPASAAGDPDSLVWLFAPVANEVPEGWADVPAAESFVAVGWQGLLRDLHAGQPVAYHGVTANALLRRAQLVAASADEFPSTATLRSVASLLGPDSELLMTAGHRGGCTVGPKGRVRVVYPPIPAREQIDPTGAGDVMMAALVAALTSSDPTERVRSRGRHLRFAATAASLLVEQPGLDAVPDGTQICLRIAAGNASTQPS